MAYGDNRNQVATDDFSTDPFTSRWANGEGDWANMSWTGSDYVEPSGGSDCAMRRNNSETYEDDQYSTITAQSAIDSGAYGGPTCRMQSGTDESAYVSYIDSGTPEYSIWETTAAFGFTRLAGTGTPSVGAGDTVTLEAEGTTLRLGSNETGTDTQRVTTTDNTITSGDPGIAGSFTQFESDSWAGGSIGLIAITSVDGDETFGQGDTDIVITGIGFI